LEKCKTNKRGRIRIEGAGKEDAEEKIYWNCDGRCKRKQVNIQ
jgi:hypothetical protein